MARRGRARRPRRADDRLRRLPLSAGRRALAPGRRSGRARGRHCRGLARSGGFGRRRLARGARSSRAPLAGDPAGDCRSAVAARAAGSASARPLVGRDAGLRLARVVHPLAPGSRLAWVALSDGAGPSERDSDSRRAVARRLGARGGARARPCVDAADTCLHRRAREDHQDRCSRATAVGQAAALGRIRGRARRARSAPLLLTPSRYPPRLPQRKESKSMHPNRARARALVGTAVAAVCLTVVSSAWAHAEITPPVTKSKTLQLFTLAVPTEKEGLTTTKVELTPPGGFAIDSFAPAAGWKRQLQQTGSGEHAVIQKVTWSGGSVPTGEDSVFQFLASPNSSKTYTFTVRQTYSDGSVVDWSGPESSDTPAPRIDAMSSLEGGGSSTLAIVALVVAGIAVLLAGVGLATRGGSRPLA